ncbi:hypothetical protein [Candidatus Sulfurimonas baltica]|uniref:Uncharacterized protein n=1 Tax=Candidatus Sulfurimonas baltica TaxID=2740404 RepID=A0A7S7LYB4_9BACT|nr:hypothetical protein [Candidatus Sulfurimonas baltica]QOY52834.1 hypothetical protein HUE88_03870 [Candidatus Sulfurimonas baltica]
MRKFSYKNIGISILTASMLLTGCSSSGGGTSSDPVVAADTVISGAAVDGYLYLATVCVDLNVTGVCNIGSDPITSTDINGSFTLTMTPEQKAIAEINKAPMLVYGGTDVDTNQPFVGSLKAPLETKATINITPITTMVEAVLASGGTVDDAKQKVADALGLDVNDVDKDPVAEALSDGGTTDLLRSALTIHKIIEVLAAASVADGSQTNKDAAVTAIYSSLANAIVTVSGLVADSNGTAGMAEIVTVASQETNTSLSSGAQEAVVLAQTIEDQLEVALPTGTTGTTSETISSTAIGFDDAIEEYEARVETSIDNNTTISDTEVLLETDPFELKTIALVDLLSGYSITASEGDINATINIAGYTFTTTTAELLALSGVPTSITNPLSIAYNEDLVEAYLLNLDIVASDSAVYHIAILEGFSSDMTTAAFSELIHATGNAELMALALVITPPEGLALLTDVEQAKAIFTELRTQAMSVVDYDNSGTPGFLDTEALSMESALNGAAIDIGFLGEALDGIITRTNFAMDTNQTTLNYTIPGTTRNVTLTDNNISGSVSWGYAILDTNNNAWSGTVTYPDIVDENLSAFSYTTLTANIVGTLPQTYEIDTNASLINSQSFDGSVTVTKTTEGASIAIEGSVSSNGDSFTISNLTANVGYDVNATTGEPIGNYFKLNGLTLAGTVGNYSVNGTLTVNSYAQNTLWAAKGGIVDVPYSSFGVNFTCSDMSAPVGDLTFNFDGASYIPDYTYAYDNGVQIQSENYFNDINVDAQYSDIVNLGNYTGLSCSIGTLQVSSYGSWNWSESNIYNSGWLPSEITFNGTLTNTTASVTGDLNAQWLNVVTIDLDGIDATPLVDVTFDGSLNMPSRPEMALHLGFTNSATQNNITATYSYDTTAIVASAVFDSNMTNGEITITSDGITADVVVDNGGINYTTSTLTKGSLTLGSFEDRAGVPVIKYVDGSFESLP